MTQKRKDNGGFVPHVDNEHGHREENKTMYKLKDEGAFFKAVEYSISKHGINSVAINHYSEVVTNLMYCPEDTLAELLSLIDDFKDYGEEALHEKHDGHSWLDFMYAVCGEFTERIIHGNKLAVLCDIDRYSDMTYFLEDDMNGKD